MDNPKKQIKKRKRAPRKNEGAPLIKFDEEQWKTFEKLCGLQCTKIEITEWLGVDDKTLDRLLKSKYKMSFSEVYLKKRSKGFTSLRKSNFKMAKVNAPMAKFLSTNYLGLRDKTELEVKHSLLEKYQKMSPEERKAEWAKLDKESKG